MDFFKENKCRKCKKVFCCKKCRLKHEEMIHNVNPDCDICFYGKCYLIEFPQSLLDHLKICHWPLHCVNCKRMFGSINELVMHNKCPVARKIDGHGSINSPITPNIAFQSSGISSSNYSSPPIMYPFGTNISGNALFANVNGFLFVTTSTPLASGEEKVFLEKMSQSITPVETNRNSDLEMFSKTNSKSKLASDEPLKDQSMKRRVTFNDTPLIETSIKSSKTKCLKGKPGNLIPEKLDSHPNSDQQPLDTKQEVANSQTVTRTPAAEERENVINEDKIFTPKDETTLWQSASCETPVESKLPYNSSIKSVDSSPEFSKSNFESTGGSNKITFDSTYPKEHILKPLTRENVGIWSSVTNLVKNIVQGLSGSVESQKEGDQGSHTKRRSLKRARLDSDNSDERKRLKKIKLTDVKCRRPINCTMPYQRCTRKSKSTIDKCTQTD